MRKIFAAALAVWLAACFVLGHWQREKYNTEIASVIDCKPPQNEFQVVTVTLKRNADNVLELNCEPREWLVRGR